MPELHEGVEAVSIALLRQWLGPAAPSPHDTELRRLVRDALIEHDALVASLKQPEIDEPLRCATFDKSGITPEIRARMDADRAAAKRGHCGKCGGVCRPESHAGWSPT